MDLSAACRFNGKGPINSPVEVLLTMLAMCPLTSVKAVNAGLYGEVSVDNFQSVMRRSLLSLDVSQNNISELLDLPVEPNLGRVTVRENTPLRVAPGLLAKALTQGIILDLSETMLLNQEEAQGLTLKITDVFVFRNETGGYACKDVVNSELKVTPSKFLPQQLCTCQAGWFGSGAACTICPENTFSDQMGGTCKSCPANSTAPPGSTKLRNCRCRFGDLHDGQCSCDKHQTLKDGNCILCSKLHLECNSTDSNASTAVPEVRYMRLEPWATEARRCLPPGAMERCPGSDQCGAGYSGTLCSSCADGFWPKRGRQCPSDIRKSLGRLVLLLLVGLAGPVAAAETTPGAGACAAAERAAVERSQRAGPDGNGTRKGWESDADDTGKGREWDATESGKGRGRDGKVTGTGKEWKEEGKERGGKGDGTGTGKGREQDRKRERDGKKRESGTEMEREGYGTGKGRERDGNRTEKGKGTERREKAGQRWKGKGTGRVRDGKGTGTGQKKGKGRKEERKRDRDGKGRVRDG
eukprot:Skav217290  [mRNA]  locus=scaffold1466:92849:99053:+ [translate_table: standard]